MTRFMHYATMGSFHINGGQRVAFNASWEEFREILGLGPSLGLAFHSSCSLLSALVCVKEDDFVGDRRKVRHG